MRIDFNVLLKAERIRHAHPWCDSVLRQTPWANWQYVRLYMVLNEHELGTPDAAFTIDGSLTKQCLRPYHDRIPDEKGGIPSQAHQIGIPSSCKLAEPSRIMQTLTEITIPSERGIPQLIVDAE